MIYWVCSSATSVIMYFVYTYMPDWDKYIFYFLGLHSVVLFVGMYFMVMETPHFLLFYQKDLGKFDECIDRLAKFNDCTPE